MGSRIKLTREERQERDDYEALLKTMYHKVRILDSKTLFFATNNTDLEQEVLWDLYFMKRQIFADKYLRQVLDTRTFVLLYYSDEPRYTKGSVTKLAIISKRTGEVKYTFDTFDTSETTRYSTAYGSATLLLCRRRFTGELNEHLLLILDNTSDRMINTLQVHDLGFTTSYRANLEIREYVDGIGAVTRNAIIFPEKPSKDDQDKPGYLGTTFNNKESLFLRIDNQQKRHLNNETSNST